MLGAAATYEKSRVMLSGLVFGSGAEVVTRQGQSIEELHRIIAKQRQQIQQLSAQHLGTPAEGDHDEPPSLFSTAFVPLQAESCHGVKPCMHSTPLSRVNAGCTDGVWRGTFPDQKGRVDVTHPDGNKSFYIRAPMAASLVPFRSVVGEECDLTGPPRCLDPTRAVSLVPVPPSTSPSPSVPPSLLPPPPSDPSSVRPRSAVDIDVWAVSKLVTTHVKDAVQRHWQQRLWSMRNSLLLFIGSSIDHEALKAACNGFGATQLVERTGARTTAWPQELFIDYCRVPTLNLTLVCTYGNGLTTTAVQRNEKVQHSRFEELTAALGRLGWHGAPTYLVFGGIEWDAKNWKCAYPTTIRDWHETMRTLGMQVEVARTTWPQTRGVFVRTMFRPTSGQFNCACCSNETVFNKYSELLRRHSTGRAIGIDHAPGAAGGRSELASRASTAAMPAVCSRLNVLDLQRMVPCNDSVGACGSITKWTEDGLHPSRPVMLQFMSLSLQVISDVGSVCGPTSDDAATVRART